MMTCATSIALPMAADSEVRPNERWFSSRGCVVHRGDERDVFVGGTLIGTFGIGDDGHRNAILIGLLSDEAARVGRNAAAFDLVPETLRVLRRVHAEEGLGAVVARKRGGSESKVTPKLRARINAMFEAGLGASAVRRKLRGRLSLRTVTYAQAAWRAQNASRAPRAARSARGRALRHASEARRSPLRVPRSAAAQVSRDRLCTRSRSMERPFRVRSEEWTHMVGRR